ncbi:MAG: hydrogenase, partial [Bacteroidota bacterium]
MSTDTQNTDLGLSGDGHVSEHPPLVEGNYSFHDITELVAHHAEKKTPKLWYPAFGLAVTVTGLMLSMLAYLVWNGTGVWGLNNPVG